MLFWMDVKNIGGIDYGDLDKSPVLCRMESAIIKVFIVIQMILFI